MVGRLENACAASLPDAAQISLKLAKMAKMAKNTGSGRRAIFGAERSLPGAT